MKSMQTVSSSLRGGWVIRFAAATLAICCCLWAVYAAARIGLSRRDSKDALTTGSLAAAERAVSLSPSDADAHFALAVALSVEGRTDEILKEYEEAARLRPLDYFLWLSLGTAREQAGDEKGALNAFEEAVRLAPSYAQPRWQLGNLLLRSGRRDEAFAELRRAALNDPSLVSGFIDLAWGIYGGDAARVEQVVQPQSAEWRLRLARFLIKHGKTAEGLQQFRAAGNVADEERTALLQELLTARRFREAYEIWSDVRARQGTQKPSSDVYSITDGGFEELKNLDGQGFGWRRGSNLQAVNVSLDTSGPHSGKYSLRLDYKGDSNPNAPVLTQLLLVEADSHYRLRFAARTQDVVTGGLPMVVIADAGSDREQRIAQSSLLPKNSNGWQDYVIEFTTGKESSAVQVSIVREACGNQPCPIFGSVWLDDFTLQKS